MNIEIQNKVLFISDNLPHELHAGGLIYQQITQAYGPEKFCYLATNKISRNHIANNVKRQPYKQFSIRIPTDWKMGKYVKKIPFIETIYVIIRVRLLKKIIITYAKNQKCSLIFAILRADPLLILEKIQRELNIPIVGFIPDTIEAEHLDYWLIYKLKRLKYYRLINKATILGVAGETMQEYIKTYFNKEARILRLGFTKNGQILRKEVKDKINILFSGSLYAKDEMFLFIKALESFAEKYKNIKIILYILSREKVSIQTQFIQIINLSWMSEENLIRIAKKCHLSYLPYKFDISDEFRMKYAFPNKSGFYIANELPIYFHGPHYSSFNSFLLKYKVGVSCNSLNPSEILNKFESIIFDKDMYRNCITDCKRAYKNEFHESVLKNNVREIISIGLNSNI